MKVAFGDIDHNLLKRISTLHFVSFDQKVRKSRNQGRSLVGIRKRMPSGNCLCVQPRDLENIDEAAILDAILNTTKGTLQGAPVRAPGQTGFSSKDKIVHQHDQIRVQYHRFASAWMTA